MNLLIFYFLSFLLTELGFLLGKSTKYEHKEIKNTTQKIIEIILLIYFALLSYFFYSSSYILFILILLGFHLYALERRKKILLELNELFIYSVTFVLIYDILQKYLFLLVIPIIYIFLKNSFRKFIIKEEVYRLITILVFFLIMNLIMMFL